MTIKKIMVVDDSPTERAFMEGLLKKRGYEVVVVESGEAAIERAKADLPDLILMDLALPKLDGWEACRQLKADAKTADIPIIALTAFAMRGDEERARQAGCDGYLSKPCRPQTIREAVRRLLEAR